MFSSNQKYYQCYPFLLLDAAQDANGRYARITAFEAISMDLSPECDMKLKGLTKESQSNTQEALDTHAYGSGQSEKF